MTSPNHSRFSLLIGWCCLMTSALLIITVYLVTSSDKKSEKNATQAQYGDPGKKENNTKSDQMTGLPNGLSFSDYIRLIRDTEKFWICSDPCESSSLSLKNGSVEITVAGLYYIHAQVGIEKRDHLTKADMKTTVILLKDKGPGIQMRKLSEVTSFGPGSVTMIRLVKLGKKESISLNIDYEGESMSEEDHHTYWEIIRFNNKL